MSDTVWAAQGRIDTPTIPLRPLGVSELLDHAVRLVRTNARASFTLAFPFAVLRTAAFATLTYQTVQARNFVFVQILGQFFVSALLGTVLTGLLAPVFAGELLGRRITAGQSLRTVGRRGLPLVVLALTVAVAQEFGVVVFYVGGAFLWGIWAVAAPALTIERLGVGRALGRSYDLVRSEFWRTWGTRALRWLITYALGMLITFPISALAAYVSGSALFTSGGASVHNPAVYTSIVAVGTLIATTLLTPIGAAVDTLLYLDLRMRREGMDITLGLPAAPAPTPPQTAAW